MVSHSRFKFFNQIPFFFLKQPVNYYIGVDGAAHIAEALKINTTLTVLGLGGE